MEESEAKIKTLETIRSQLIWILFFFTFAVLHRRAAIIIVGCALYGNQWMLAHEPAFNKKKRRKII